MGSPYSHGNHQAAIELKREQGVDRCRQIHANRFDSEVKQIPALEMPLRTVVVRADRVVDVMAANAPGRADQRLSICADAAGRKLRGGSR